MTLLVFTMESVLPIRCPAFKILTYYGTQKERKMKRQGWTKPNAFHICITSYKLVIQVREGAGDSIGFSSVENKYQVVDFVEPGANGNL